MSQHIPCQLTAYYGEAIANLPERALAYLTAQHGVNYGIIIIPTEYV